jgi:nitrogen-specific signal transduction histidine kinase
MLPNRSKKRPEKADDETRLEAGSRIIKRTSERMTELVDRMIMFQSNFQRET